MNPIMQPIINKYVVLYVAHPFGGDLDNVSRAEIQLSKLRKLLPRHTLENANQSLSKYEREAARKIRIKTRQRNMWILISAGLGYLVVK